MKYIIKKSKILNYIVFCLGQLFFEIFGKTPKIAYMAMINLYCLTNGRFLEKINSKKEFSSLLKSQSKLFKKITPENIHQVAREIKKEGYKIFGHKLDSKVTEELKSLSYKLKAKVGNGKILFDPNFNPLKKP